MTLDVLSRDTYADSCTSPDDYEVGGPDEPKGKKAQTVPARVSTAELVDFIKAQALKRRTKELAELTGLTQKGVANLRQGLAGASAQTISTWCRNDPAFRADYFAWVGGYLENDPEFVAGLSRLINNYARKLHGGK